MGAGEGGWLAAALELDGHGFRVLPASAEKKVPALWLVGENKRWKRWQVEATTSRLRGWLDRDDGDEIDGLALCVLTGAPSKLGVLDIDSPGAYAMWRSIIGDDLDATCQVRTQSYDTKGGGGVGHYYWRLEGGIDPQGSSQSDQEAGAGLLWDWKARGGHVIVPPSVGYTWIDDRGLDRVLAAPEALLAAIAARRPGAAPASRSLQEGGGGATAPRSLLSKLLESPPQEDTGRNSWLTAIAGHLARREHEDVYRAQLGMANRSLAVPLDDAAVQKVADSIWRSEQAKQRTTDETLVTDSTGFLTGTGTQLQCWCDGKGIDPGFKSWADFDLQALGIMHQADGTTVYRVEIQQRDRPTTITNITASTLGSTVELHKWAASYRCTFITPAGDVGAKLIQPGYRIQRYLEAQKPPDFRTVDYLGWHDGIGFICHEGVIDRDGLREHEGVVPHPRLAEWAPFHYGFDGGPDDARALLRQVLTFHDETVAAVFASWAVAVVLKAQIMRYASLFPFMALEAGSESGKTTGMFAMLMQMLSGARAGQNSIASMRDALSSNRSGIVWIDDLSDTSKAEELIRHATAEGEMTKKGQDRTSQETVRLVGAVVLSAESLGALHAEKALADRALLLNVPNPKTRRSLINPEQAQWADVMAVHRAWPGERGLSAVAGHIVRAILEQADLVDLWPEICGSSAGRYADKMCVLRIGARVLSNVVTDETIVGLVDGWVETQVDLGSENALTMAILPEFLAGVNVIQPSARGAEPAFIDEHERLWVSASRLADWYLPRHRNNPRAQQHGNVRSITSQLDDIGSSAPVRKHTSGSDTGGQLRYRVVPDEYARLVYERAGVVPRHPAHPTAASATLTLASDDV